MAEGHHGRSPGGQFLILKIDLALRRMTAVGISIRSWRRSEAGVRLFDNSNSQQQRHVPDPLRASGRALPILPMQHSP